MADLALIHSGDRPYNGSTDTPHIDAVSSGRPSPPLIQSKPLAEAASKDSHSPSTARPQLVLRSNKAPDGGPGLYRVFDPHPPYLCAGFSVTEDCARRLLHEGKVRLVRSGKR